MGTKEEYRDAVRKLTHIRVGCRTVAEGFRIRDYASYRWIAKTCKTEIEAWKAAFRKLKLANEI